MNGYNTILKGASKKEYLLRIQLVFGPTNFIAVEYYKDLLKRIIYMVISCVYLE